MMNKMQSIEQVEILSRVLIEQTDETMKELKKEIDIDNYLSEEISSVLLCENELKFIYDKLPTLEFSGVVFSGKSFINEELKNSKLFAVGVRLTNYGLKIKTVIEKSNGNLITINFDAEDVNTEK